jgi:hypothetical protein
MNSHYHTILRNIEKYDAIPDIQAKMLRSEIRNPIEHILQLLLNEHVPIATYTKAAALAAKLAPDM